MIRRVHKRMSQPQVCDIAESAGLVTARRICLGGGIFTAAVGGIGLAGWLFNSVLFRSLVPGLPVIKANTAIVVFLIGLNLLLCRNPVSSSRLLLGRIVSWAATTLAGATLLEYALSMNLGVDQMFFLDWGVRAGPNPGRMAPITALSLTLLGTAMLLRDRKRIPLQGVAEGLAIFAGSIGLVATAGYLYSTVPLYKIASETSMALPTALSVVGAALALLCSRPKTGLMKVVWSEGRGGEMARRLLPIGLFAPITLGWLRLTAQRAGYFGIEVGLGVMVISMTALLVGAFLLTAKAVDKSEHNQRMAEENARDLSEQLSEQKLRKTEERFRSLVEGVKDYAIFLLDSRGFVASWNAGAERIKGYRADEIIGQHFSRFYPTEVIAEGKPEKVLETAAREGRFTEEGWRLRKDKSRFWASVVITALRDENGHLQGFSKVTRDITERKIMEEALFAEKERAQVTLNCIGDAVACTDIRGNISFLNLVAETMTGWSSHEAIQRHKSDILRILVTASRETIKNPMDFAVGEGPSTPLPLDCVLVRRDGFEIPIEGSVAPIHDRAGEPSGAVIVFRDVRAARAITDQITHSAEHDFLTGLPNRMLLNDRVGQAITLALRQKKQVAVLFLDLDGFKHINDSLGHSIGDQLLQSIAERLVHCVRSADTVSRQGGDEFVVLLSEMERPEDAAVSARRLLQEVARSHSIGQHDLYVSASIGISIYPGDSADAETLIKNADAAMYQAKEDGRHSYQFFTPAMNVRAVERQSIEESLRRALERQEFTLDYQPKISLRSGRITGAEALLRWTHPTRGLVPPGQFIPVAEDCGLILPIGRWVLREACRQAMTWLESGLPHITVAVNISAIEFRDEHFLESAFAIIRETGLDPRSLELELTESVLMKRAESTEFILRALRARGVRLAVDDFGTGYSSLSYLRKFPIDTLKIDQSFVRQIVTAPDETTIVTAIISMGRSLKLRVVAEGVETQQELAFLQAHNCDEAQGYYFSRPLAPREFALLLENGLPQSLWQPPWIAPVQAS